MRGQASEIGTFDRWNPIRSCGAGRSREGAQRCRIPDGSEAIAAPRISGAAVGPDCEGLPETEDGLSGVDTERLGCDVHAS
jgi:hypothetical protein